MKLTGLLHLIKSANARQMNLVIRASILLAALMFATSASLHAQTQAAQPAANFVSVVQSWPNGYSAPPYETITLQLEDTTPGATIHGTVICTGTWSGPEDIDASSGTEIVYYGSNEGSCTGTIYATAPGYTQSASTNVGVN